MFVQNMNRTLAFVSGDDICQLNTLVSFKSIFSALNYRGLNVLGLH